MFSVVFIVVRYISKSFLALLTVKLKLPRVVPHVSGEIISAGECLATNIARY